MTDLNQWCRDLFTGPRPLMAVLYSDGLVSTFTDVAHPLTFLADPPKLTQPVEALGCVQDGTAVHPDGVSPPVRVSIAVVVSRDTTCAMLASPKGLSTVPKGLSTMPPGGAVLDAMIEWLQACPTLEVAR